MNTILRAAIATVAVLACGAPLLTASSRLERASNHQLDPGVHVHQARPGAPLDQARDVPPRGLDLPAGVKMPSSLAFIDASSSEALAAIAAIGGVSLVFDPAFTAAPITVEVGGLTLEQALDAATRAAGAFFHVTASNIVTVAPDTPSKRQQYEGEEVVRTFYLSNADPKEAIDLLRLALDARRVAPSTSINAVSMKDAPDRIAAAARLLSTLDKASPEVVVDVELIEADRAKLREYGLQVASPGAPGIAGGAAIIPRQPAGTQPQDSTFSLQALAAPRASNVVVANLPALTLRLLKSDTSTRTLLNSQIRAEDGVTAQTRMGDRVPVPVATFTPIVDATAGGQQLTSYTYENIGVNIDITPRVHHNGDVTLALVMSVGNLEAATGYGGLPQFSNWQFNTTVRLKDGETSLVAGLVKDDQAKLLEAIPGLSDLPGVGRLFAHTRTGTDRTDIVLALTPHVVRTLEVSEADLRAFRAARETAPPAPETPVPPGQPRTPEGLAGTWTGDLPDIPGTPQMTWTLRESGDTVAGHVTVALPGGFTLMDGTLAGTLSGSTLTYTVTVVAGAIPAAPSCAGQVTGTAGVTPDRLTGSASVASSSCLPPMTTMGFVLTRQ